MDIGFFYYLERFYCSFGLQAFHNVENDFAGVALLKAVSVGEVAVFEYVGKSYSGSHVVKSDFKNAADHVAFNHDDERGVVLVSDVA